MPNACINITAKRVGVPVNILSKRLGHPLLMTVNVLDNSLSTTLSRHDGPITIYSAKYGQELSYQSERHGEPLSFRCGLVCTVGSKFYLEVPQESIWLLPENAFSQEVVVYANVSWTIE